MTSDSEIRKLCEELVKAAVELAIVRHDLCRDDNDMDVSAIAEDVANAVIGAETCAEEPIPEYTKLVAALREKLEAERWIPVSERLPEIEKAVWVWADGAPRVAMRSNPENEGWLWYFSQCGWDLLHGDFEMEDATVTHWRPLPSSPEVKA